MRIGTIQIAVLGIAVGWAAGVGVFTFAYARGASYLTNDPAACANCHIMHEHYDAWIKSSHRAVAVCNDCHTPAGFVGKWTTKGDNGFWHSFAFTTGRYPDPLRITGRNQTVAERSCRKCHADMVEAIEGHEPGAATSCTRCHAGVGHLK
jgi:cytochrome c nitrite reductase small subunit